VQRIGPRDETVLITGESGTGKERIADALVAASKRADKPFIRFNCAALTAELAEAELFGHTRGAFTGAVKSRPGLFREADGGTILLDEIGELPLPIQAKLLRVLQEGEVRPVGEDQSFKVDIRLIAATHLGLTQMAAQGTFREDPLRRRSLQDDADAARSAQRLHVARQRTRAAERERKRGCAVATRRARLGTAARAREPLGRQRRHNSDAWREALTPPTSSTTSNTSSARSSITWVSSLRPASVAVLRQREGRA
jgi:sigma54-dependent transcription regulator